MTSCRKPGLHGRLLVVRAAALLLVVASGACAEPAAPERAPATTSPTASTSATPSDVPGPRAPDGADFQKTAVEAVKKGLAAQGSSADDFDLSCEGAYVDSNGHWVERCAEGSIQAAGGLEIWMRAGDDQTIDVVTVSSDDACTDQPAWLVEMARRNGSC